MIEHFIPANLNKDLGAAYNRCMNRLDNASDWAVFSDRDVMFLQDDYLQIIDENIRKHRNVGMFTCLTNRVGNKNQLYQQRVSMDPNVLNHYAIGEKLAKEQRTNIVIAQTPVSGHVMIIQKSVWGAIGGAPEGKILGVDNNISYKVRKKGYRVGILQGLYVFHYYRFHKGIHDKSHLLQA